MLYLTKKLFMTNKFLQKLNTIYNEYPIIGSFFIFCLVFLLGSLFCFSDTGSLFKDDHFFHFKYAYLLRTQGFEINKHFDWMYLTDELRENHLHRATLFQIALIPFTFFKDLKTGLQISDIFWASSTLSLVYYSFRKLNISYPFLLISSLITFNFSIIRLLAGRTFVFSIGLLFLSIYFAIKEKYYKFFFISLLCLLWHPAIFFMPFVVAVLVEIARYVNFKKFNLKGITGSLIAILISSLYFSFNTFIDLFAFFKKILFGVPRGEGVEMQKINIFQIATLSEIFLLMLVMSFAFVSYVYLSSEDSPKRKNNQALLTIYVAFLFLFMSLAGTTLINGRFIDYYGVGVTFLVGACISYLKLKQGRYIIEKKLKNFLFAGISIFLFIIGTITFLSIEKIIQFNDVTPNKLVAQWVSSESSDKDKVYLYNWSDFPINFFFNDKNTYSVGMDPMQLFYYDEGLYWKWYNIFNNDIYCDLKEDCLKQKESLIFSLKNSSKEKSTLLKKETSKKIIESIKNDFQAKYIISGNENKDLFELNPELIANSFSAKSEINGEVVWGYKLK